MDGRYNCSRVFWTGPPKLFSIEHTSKWITPNLFSEFKWKLAVSPRWADISHRDTVVQNSTGFYSPIKQIALSRNLYIWGMVIKSPTPTMQQHKGSRKWTVVSLSSLVCFWDMVVLDTIEHLFQHQETAHRVTELAESKRRSAKGWRVISWGIVSTMKGTFAAAYSWGDE